MPVPSMKVIGKVTVACATLPDGIESEYVSVPHWISVPSGILQYPEPLSFVSFLIVPFATPFLAC